MADINENLDHGNPKDKFQSVKSLGIVQLGGLDVAGRPVIVFAACRLPKASEINMDLLSEYLIWQIRSVVESDYSIVYLHSGMLPGISLPASWLYRVWKSMDRAYKKNLKALYIVHPSLWVRAVIVLCRPFISPKFWVKLTNVYALEELNQHVRLEQLDIPAAVTEYNASLRRPKSTSTNPTSSKNTGRKHAQFGVSLDTVAMDGDIPLVLAQAVAAVRENGLQTEGIFRKSAALSQVQAARRQYDNGEAVDLSEFDVHVAASLLKAFLRELPTPIISDFGRVLAFSSMAYLCEPTRNASQIHILVDIPEEARDNELEDMLKGMKPGERAVLETVLRLMNEVATFSDMNKMTLDNLSIVFAPNLMWSTDTRASPAATLSSLHEQHRFLTSLCKHISGGSP